MLTTKKTFKGFNGKQLLNMSNDNCSPVTIDGENYILTPRKFIATNRVEICSNDDANAVEVLDRYDHITLVAI